MAKYQNATHLSADERAQVEAVLQQQYQRLCARYEMYELHAAYLVRADTLLEQRCWEIRAHNEVAIMERSSFLIEQLLGADEALLAHRLAITAPRGDESRWGLGIQTCVTPTPSARQVAAWLPPGWQLECTDTFGRAAAYHVAVPHQKTRDGRRLLQQMSQLRFRTLSGPTIARIFTAPAVDTARLHPDLYPRHWGDIFLLPHGRFVVFTPPEWRQHADCDAIDYCELDKFELTDAITETDVWFSSLRIPRDDDNESETETHGGDSDLPD